MASAPRQPGEYLVHLLKHAFLRLSEASTAAVAGLGIDRREFAVLLTLAAGPGSQQDAAGRLGIDRTTMVALLDALVGKGLVERRQDPADRRRNLVALTEAGRGAVKAGSRASELAERAFLAPLSAAEAATLAETLRRLTTD